MSEKTRTCRSLRMKELRSTETSRGFYPEERVSQPRTCEDLEAVKLIARMLQVVKLALEPCMSFSVLETQRNVFCFCSGAMSPRYGRGRVLPVN
jgi:hypothetical protein